jgi:tetratricopeptide repeat protein
MKLDDQLGPALPLSPEAEEKLISFALDQAFEKKRRRWLPIAAAALVLLGTPAAIAAWMSARKAERIFLEPPPPVRHVVVPKTMAEPPPPVAEEKPKKAKKKREAEDLLAKANTLRRSSKWREAESVYLEVAERFPKSGSAYVALVAAASLRLEHLDDPAGALALLARAAKKSGPLDAEILWHQSRAHRQRGDAQREFRALERMLKEHPGSPFTEAAEDRLRELSQ